MLNESTAIAAENARARFAEALAATAAAARCLPIAGARYQRAIDRLLAAPAPDLAGPASKLETADPLNLDHFAAIVADARRLAALPMGLEVDDARALLEFIDSAEPAGPVPASVVAFADRLEGALRVG